MLDIIHPTDTPAAADVLPLIIDSFAGGGGASTGIEQALGRSPDVAINHNAAALALHAANHPDTLHLSNDIWDVDPVEIAGGRHVGLLWASPDCKHFSKAKGGAPRDRNIRDLAWVVVRWAEHVKPDVILMENVEEFQGWGPVCNAGQPIKEFEGQTFELWVKRLRRAGYRVQWRELRACDYGAPTIRKRFFMIARRDGRPITWPKPTHGAPDSVAVKRGHRLPWRTAAECIDWSLPCPSIFDTKEQIKALHGLTAVRPLAPNTLARVARGMKRYVIDADRPFLVNLTSPTIINVANSKTSGRGINTWQMLEPTRTITSSSGFALVAPSITRFNGGATGQDLCDPMSTVTANSFIKRPGGAAPLGIVAPALATFYGHDGGRGKRAADITDPLRTVTVENRHALIAPLLSHLYTSNTAGGEGKMDRPLKTVTAGGGHHALVAPSLISIAHGDSGGRREYPLSETMGVVTSGGIAHALTAPYLAQHNTTKDGEPHPGRAATAPISTITRSGSHQGVVAPWFAKYYGAGTGARTDEPCHTVTVKDRFGHAQASLTAPPFTETHAARAREVADFLRAHDAWDDREFVTLEIEGVTFVIVDIGMRMLAPRELFNAQGFPADYVIEGVWQERDGDWHWQPFSKSTQVSCCGNSVCPDLARALVTANCGHLAVAADAAGQTSHEGGASA